jgi:hypothetical protein
MLDQNVSPPVRSPRSARDRITSAKTPNFMGAPDVRSPDLRLVRVPTLPGARGLALLLAGAACTATYTASIARTGSFSVLDGGRACVCACVERAASGPQHAPDGRRMDRIVRAMSACVPSLAGLQSDMRGCRVGPCVLKRAEAGLGPRVLTSITSRR